ncbi:MAG: hypothetical protein KJ674_02445 [Nanoarchaeota archaeon]|nr:hypothetical protein [Nanoarchaeota archaeon]
MVHKRYIKKNGKVYGPYLYRSVRDKSGKVKNIYIGNEKKDKNINSSYLSILVVLLILIGFYYGLNYTGFVVSDLGENKTQNMKEVVIKDNLGNKLDKKVEFDGENYNLDIESKDKKSKLKIKVKNLPDNINTYIGDISDSRIKSEIVAVQDNLEMEVATITLEKIKQIDYILYCQNFDFNNLICNNWEITDIPFISNENSITFTVTHFSAYAGGGGNNSNLTIWDDTDSNTRYTLGSDSGEDMIYFFANYTNMSSGVAIDDATFNCSISFNSSGSWSDPVNMTFNSTSLQYEYNSTFNVKGTYLFNATCEDNIYDRLSITDEYAITNTWPEISPKPLIAMNCDEDTMCYYNFSTNVTDPDNNDVLTYSRDSGTFFSCFDMDSTTGVINFTCYIDSDAISGYSMTLIVTDDNDGSDSTAQIYTINAVNDRPNLTSIGTLTANEDEAFNYDALASDEEDGNEDSNNLSYSDNSTLFNITQGNGIISFTPTQSQVGMYWINISVNDSFGLIDSEVINFTIFQTGDAPYFDYVCDTDRNATEDILFNCTISGTSVDPNDVLTFNSNESWFLINASGNVSFTPANNAVGVYWVNITINGTYNVMNSTLIQFNVTNANDAPILSTIGNQTAYGGILFNLTLNASDDDMSTADNDSLFFWSNDTYLFNISKINNMSAELSFTPTNNDAGTYWFNISVNDSSNIIDSEIINITILVNYPPNITAAVDNNVTEDVEFYLNLSLNVSDNDNDALNFSDNTTLFDINITSGVINFTVNDSFVGLHWVNITVTDEHGANSSQVLNFTVFNVNDRPNLTIINGNFSVNEDSEFYLNLSLNVTDEDKYIPFGNIFGINEVLTFNDNTSLFDIGILTGEINFTFNITQVGNYWINISVNDSSNAMDSRVINFTIVNVNDAPILNSIGNQTATENIVFSYDVNVSDEEDGMEVSWNFTYSINVSFISINATSGVFNFTPNSTHANVGFYWINISVNDSNNALASEVFNLTIYNINNAPSIDIQSPANSVVSMVENTSKTFIVTISDADVGDTITYDWTLDGRINETDVGIIAGGTNQQNFIYVTNWTDSGEHNLTIFVYDDANRTSFAWNITVNNSNAPITFEGIIANITWNEDTSYSSLDLDTYFRDSDGNSGANFSYVQMNESHSVLGSSSIGVGIDNDTRVVTFTPDDNWFGNETIYFIGNDSEYWIVSNNFTLRVTDVAESTSDSTSSGSSGGGGGGGGSSSVTKIASLDIILPPSITMYSIDQTTIPIILRNKGGVVLNTITVLAISDSGVFELKLDKNSISQLSLQNEDVVNLDIISGLLEPGSYTIYINADVGDPSLSESAELYIEIHERNETVLKDLENMISFTKDLFEQNPECLELRELIDKANEKLAGQSYDEGMRIINSANQACKDIMNMKKRAIEMPKGKDLLDVWWLYPLELIGLLIVIYLIKYYIKRKKFSKK